jgi:virulence-associated protein VagC
MFDLLLRLVWLVEEKPVVTRFFLFAPCCFALLRMVLLGLPADVFSAGLLGLETESSKWLQAVKAFYTLPDTPKLLRRVCLCLQLTMFATSLAAKKKHKDEVPVIVALGRGEVQERTADLFATIVPLLTSDPVLDASDAFRALLLTQTHLVIRFDMYLRYPTKLWRLTKTYNKDLYAIEIVDFLYTDDKLLDAGYSALLKREAWAFGKDVEADAVGYMMSTAVQLELTGLFLTATANSLDVERKHALDKQFETTKVTGCATASRNSIIRRYLTARRLALHSQLDVQRAATSALRLNVRAIAFERQPEMFTRGRGKMRWEDSVSGKDMKAITHQGDEIALQQYIEEHREELEAELSDRRHVAKCRAVAASALPLSQDEWLRHLDDNDEEFRSLLRNAEKARRVISERVQPDAEWGAAPRLYPQVCKEHGHVPQWSHLKPEFYLFKQTDTLSIVCYVASVGHTVYACQLCMTTANKEFDLVLKPAFHRSLKSIAVVFGEAGITDDAAAYKLWWVPQRFGADRVTIRIEGAELVVLPTRAKSKAKSSHEEHVEPEDDAEFEAFMEKVEGLAARDSECDSLCSSQDTDQSSSNEANDSETSDEAKMPKKAPGTYVVYTNGYFTFTDHKDYPDRGCLTGGAQKATWVYLPKAKRCCRHTLAKSGLIASGPCGC